MNKVILCGRLTREAEIRYTQSDNKKVADITLAIRRDKENTDFINCTGFGKTAEIIEKYTSKGKELLVCGELRTNSYEDKNGIKRTKTYVLISEVQLIGGATAEDKLTSAEVEFTPSDSDDDLPF